MSNLIDRQLGQYHLAEIIGRGGMATVYKAYQPSLDRYVAVKILPANRDQQFVARFKREARAIAALQHPNILPIYGVGEQDDLLYLVLQYVEKGTTLRTLLGKPMAPAAALRLSAHVLDALDYAHSHGVIHRDIKPSNILMPMPTWPMLADFGTAKLVNDSQTRLTQANQILGTVAYMAPEQATNQLIDARTDIYAAGMVLYELVTGRVPFDGDTPLTVLYRRIYEPAPPARGLNPDLPIQIEQVLARALAREPGARYQSAAEMADELHHIATQIERESPRSQATGVYAMGVQAFGEGRWDLAVERLAQAAALDAEYEDVTELLLAAREAQERTAAEARMPIEDLRQQPKSSPQPRLRPPGEPAPPDTCATTEHPSTMAATSSRQSGRAQLLWSIAVLVIVVLLSALLALRPWQNRRNGPALSGASATRAAANRDLAAPAQVTSNLSGAGEPATNIPAAASAPTAAPPARLPDPAGKLVYTEDFSAGPARSGLEDRITATDFQRGFHAPGVYSFKIVQPHETHWEALPRQAYRDFSLQIDLNDDSDTFTGDMAQGVIFRVRDDTHFYAVLIDPRKGQYAARKLDGANNWIDLIAATDSPLVKRRTDVNHLRLDATGDAFTIYLNGRKLDGFRDGAYDFGMLGMIAANVDANEPHSHFDNINVWSDDTPIDPELARERESSVGDMALIPGGEFIMGSNEGGDAQPPHIVGLPSFYIDQTEVTNLAYLQCVDIGGCPPPKPLSSATRANYVTQADFLTFPVINVTWNQAHDFCAWAGKRLPTEAEWEKAASWNAAARTKSAWPWGDLFDPARLNSAESHDTDTRTVGRLPAQANRTFDMAGNVAEWTNSLSKPYPYDAADGREASAAPGDRIFRGGAWNQGQDRAQTFFRQAAPASFAGPALGFRCAADP